MCGIVGGLLRRPIGKDRIERALRTLHHRGPDDRGSWISDDGRRFLGHTRLSIIGLDNGHQPIGDDAGDAQLVVNGELYGYRTLRSELREQGFRFRTDSDSEIALHLYRREGMALCRRLRGEYAVLLADESQRAFFAVRDRFGIKPLFYAVHDGDVLFASEIKALLALGVPARWNLRAAHQECYQFRPHARTLFEGIHAVPPGHYAVAQDGDVSVHPYWDLDFPTADALARDPRSEAECVADFHEALDDAVRERLVADVEVASYLSGGIDSCAVLGLAQRHLDRPIRAFTLCFDDAMYDESALAREQAALSGASFHPVPVSERDLADAYSDAVWHAETPFVNGHGVAKFLLSRAVRDAGIKVVFTGEGADEMLAGYPPFRRDVLLYNSEPQDPAEAERLLAAMRDSNRAVQVFVAQGETPECVEPLRRRLGWVPSWVEAFSFVGEASREIFRPELAAEVAGASPYPMTLDRLPIEGQLAGRDPLNQALYLWARIQLPNFILTFLSDRMEMAHSIEGRVPFLDHRVAECAARLPISMKVRGMREKHVLREATRDVLIPAVYDREKHPFTTPPARSTSSALLELYGDVFHSRLLDAQPIFDPARVRELLEAFPGFDDNRRQQVDSQFNRVLSFTLMHERFGMSA